MKVTQTNSRVNQLSKPYKGKVTTISLLRKQNIQQSSKRRQNTLYSQRPLQNCQSTHAFGERKIDADANVRIIDFQMEQPIVCFHYHHDRSVLVSSRRYYSSLSVYIICVVSHARWVHKTV